MNNNYEVPEIIELGKAQDVILGSNKVEHNFDDSPIQILRSQVEVEDDE
jgi:hypothetical protein